VGGFELSEVACLGSDDLDAWRRRTDWVFESLADLDLASDLHGPDLFVVE
jgi:hypothetical protein